MIDSSAKLLVVGGVHKAGTTSVHAYFSTHEKVCVSKIKETHYFSDCVRENHPPDLEEYSRFFTAVNVKLYVEADPEYIYGGTSVAEAIKSTVDDPYILFILREPVDKLFSNYKHQKKTLKIADDIDFQGFIDAKKNVPTHFGADILSEGFYIDFLPEWYRVFPSQRIKIMFFDDLSSNPKGFMKEVCEWLGFETQWLENMEFPVENLSVVAKVKLLHKMAYAAFGVLEPVLRKNYKMKKFLREVYYRMNVRKNQDPVPEQTQEYLKLKYQEKNIQLRIFLRSQGCLGLPEWLS